MYTDRTTMAPVKRRRHFTHCFIAAVAVCLLLTIFKYIAERPTNEASKTGEKSPDINGLPKQEELPEYEYFVDAINSRADADGYVILAMSDESFVDMAINFYEASLRAHHVDNFLFVGVGRQTCEQLRNKSIPCFYYADDPSASEASDYGHRNFIRKMNIRTDMIVEALNANVSVIHTDTDVAFLRNPVNEIKVMCLVASVIFFLHIYKCHIL